MENKHILNALKRVLEEKATQIEKASKRIQELSHQIMYYNELEECFRNGVLDDLFLDMQQLGWNDWVKEIKEKDTLQAESEEEDSAKAETPERKDVRKIFKEDYPQ